MTQYRGITILCIVMVHSLYRFLDSSVWYFDYLYQLLGESTCIFCFISGFLFYHIDYSKYSYCEFVIKKAKRLLLPYFCWTLPFLVLEHIFRFGEIDIKWFLWSLVSGMSLFNGALWYIQLIFTIFLIAPLLKSLFKKNYIGEIITVITLTAALITGRDIPVKFYYGIATIPHLIGFFMFGMLCCRYKDFWVKLNRFWLIPLSIGVFLCAIQGYFHLPAPETTLKALKNITHGVTLNWLTLNKVFISFGLLLLFYKISSKKPQISALNVLAKYSFPIYFCHLLFFIPWIICGWDSKGGFIFFFAGSLYMVIGPLLTCYLLNKVKYVNKVIGL